MVQRVIEIPYAPRPLQRKIHENLRRFNVLVCHRRFGKTVLCINELIKKALEHDGKQDKRFAYIAPLYKQAKQAAWDYLKKYTECVPGRQAHETELRVDLPNGSRIRLFGADDPDAIRGIYLDGVILDEYADMSPRMWGEVIRPALSDRKGWAIFIGTPKGRNQFFTLYDKARDDPEWLAAMFRASETGYVDPAELLSARKQMDEAEYDQEFECSFSAAIKGAYWGELINAAEREGRIRVVRVEKEHPVYTAWDIGYSDDVAIWFWQPKFQEIHIVDYYENRGQDIAHYAKVLQDKPYNYGHHWFPHDAKAKTFAAGGRSVIEQAVNLLGMGKCGIVPMQSIEDGIHAGRAIIPRCWFDAERTALGLEHLRQYQREYDDQRKVFKQTPLHNFASHAGSAFRYLSQVYTHDNPELVVEPVFRPPTLDEIWERQPRRAGGYI